MTTDDPAVQVAEKFQLQSHSDDVFRVVLVQSDGKVQADALFAGSGSRATIMVPPGSYTANVMDPVSHEFLGDFPLSLPGHPNVEAMQVDLSVPTSLTELVGGNKRSRVAGLAIDSRASLSNISSSSAEEHADEDEERIDILKSGHDLSTYEHASIEPATGAMELQFSIGLSEDSALAAIEDLRQPQDIEVNVDSDSTSIVIRLQDKMFGRQSRLHLNLAVEGVPEIRIPVPLYRDGLIVRVDLCELSGRPDFLVDVAAANRKVEAMAEALFRLSNEEAIKVLKWTSEAPLDHAVEFMAHKREDLWAATVAALILIKTSHYEKIEHWYANLAKFAPHIADTSVCAAWVALVSGPEDDNLKAEKEALGHLRNACALGAPSFVVANSLMLELLNNLRTNGSIKKIRSNAGKLYETAVGRSRYRMFSTPYMIWEMVDTKNNNGELNPEQNHIVVRGKAGAERLTVTN